MIDIQNSDELVIDKQKFDEWWGDRFEEVRFTIVPENPNLGLQGSDAKEIAAYAWLSKAMIDKNKIERLERENKILKEKLREIK